MANQAKSYLDTSTQDMLAKELAVTGLSVSAYLRLLIRKEYLANVGIPLEPLL